MSIGAYYQCHKQPKAFAHSLEQFRKHYPTSELWIVNDGGNPNLEHIAKKYSPMQYELKERIYKNAHSTDYKEVDQLLEWVRRFREYVMISTSDYILLLEDDVYVLKPTNISDLKYDINGCNKGAFFYSDQVESIIRSRNPNVPDKLYYGGCGGCIFRTSFFKRILGEYQALESEIINYCKYTTNYSTDTILSYLTWINCGTIDMYPGFVETWYGDIRERLQAGTVEVMHRYVELYEKE